MKKENDEQVNEKLTEEAVMKEVLDEKKAVLFAKVAELIEDKTKVGEMQEVINDVIDASFNLGKLSAPIKESEMESLSQIGNLFGSLLNPNNSKYKQLYDSQRLTIESLLQALRTQQMQLSIHESPNSQAQCLVSTLFNPPILEKTVKEKD